ncbi:uncharacterized protein ALTATR162_LOCUS6935 [Alternaria atra]|uniref:RBR-type E3 ubiquitin transferase n=1 Tax=Alternaria atra TaxID=119953 RepID=A0A8J2I4X6_9PLEO|nr:uncharacterized protein ALTATR162_LOCUS6935 [Alternaria atra]CAG5166511.1 unnamed protein product [Alternaria atra]
MYTNTMTSAASANDGTVDPSIWTIVTHSQQKCGTCKNDLTIDDKKKGSSQYWKNCQTCREKATASQRKRRASKAAATTDATTGTQEKRRKNFDRSHAIKDFPSLLPVDDQHLAPASYRPGFAQVTGDDNRIVAQEDYKAQTSIDKVSDKPTKPTVLKPATEKECSICAEPLPAEEFPDLVDCNHDTDFCLGCFLRWLGDKVGNATTVMCPSSRCSHAVTHEDVRRHAPQDVFTRFDELSMRTFLNAETNFVYCLTEGCQSGQIHDTGVEGPIFRCAACGYRMCTAHDPVIPFHENEACTQYNERVELERVEREARDERVRVRREQDEASAAEAGRSSVECPGCGVQIQKIDGCDHMTCRWKGCMYQFCYIYRAPYVGAKGINQVGNSAHTESCLYHPKMLPAYRGRLWMMMHGHDGNEGF